MQFRNKVAAFALASAAAVGGVAVPASAAVPSSSDAPYYEWSNTVSAGGCSYRAAAVVSGAYLTATAIYTSCSNKSITSGVYNGNGGALTSGYTHTYGAGTTVVYFNTAVYISSGAQLKATFAGGPSVVVNIYQH